MENIYICHHGIKGMKWGHRNPLKKAYKDARRQVIKDQFRSQGYVVGKNSYKKYKDSVENYDKHHADYVDKAIAYKKSKHIGNKDKSEFKAYKQVLSEMGGNTTAIRNNIACKKGKEYLDRLDSSIYKTRRNAIIGSVATVAGVTVVSGIMNYRNQY